jgi:hypothetical protein
MRLSASDVVCGTGGEEARGRRAKRPKQARAATERKQVRKKQAGEKDGDHLVGGDGVEGRQVGLG